MRPFVYLVPTFAAAVFVAGCGGTSTTSTTLTLPNGSYHGTLTNNANSADTGTIQFAVDPFGKFSGTIMLSAGQGNISNGEVAPVNGAVSGTVTIAGVVNNLSGTMTGTKTVSGPFNLISGSGITHYTLNATLDTVTITGH